MKARIYFGRGQWWCRRMGVTGCGATPLAAWHDMWALYWGAATPKQGFYPNPRGGGA